MQSEGLIRDTQGYTTVCRGATVDYHGTATDDDGASTDTHGRNSVSTETLRKHYGNTTETVRKHYGNTTETLRKHYGNTTETLRNSEKPRSHIHVRGYGPRGLITDREVTDDTCSSSPVLAGKHVPTVRVRKTRAVGGFDQGSSGLYHGLPWCHR